MRLFFVFLVLLQCALLAGLGFLPTDLIPYHEILPQDKILHFSGFFILTFLTFFIWDRPRRFYNVLLTAIPIGALAFGSEILQPILSPTRAYDSHDIVANALGTTAGLTLATIADHIREARYSRQQVRYEAIEMV
ncbi:hypothetical protein BC939DRAFT_448835 [Gamsiella multidivaricata]|uniref:uncharacterized protein n=1 Tax=Gamsiella multidivaricata TaxID=101098 RepID=UPI00221FCA49|nr:uncharacterized protein BC939DRAFT_448835 [Gamsiella multidivaricata]KAI7825134.1 hypothetical protein BC939DRAFT_448835 [Gamsiella multidivaricata]